MFWATVCWNSIGTQVIVHARWEIFHDGAVSAFWRFESLLSAEEPWSAFSDWADSALRFSPVFTEERGEGELAVVAEVLLFRRIAPARRDFWSFFLGLVWVTLGFGAGAGGEAEELATGTLGAVRVLETALFFTRAIRSWGNIYQGRICTNSRNLAISSSTRALRSLSSAAFSAATELRNAVSSSSTPRNWFSVVHNTS
jgi:hypothetical protein